MKKVLYILLILNILLFYENIMAWDNNITHKDLSRFAADSSILRACINEDDVNCDYLKNIGLAKGLAEYLQWGEYKKEAKEWIAEGAKYEDNPTLRSFNHFHNPLKQWNLAGLYDKVLLVPVKGKSSLLWAQDGTYQQSSVGEDWSWQKTREYYYLALTSMTDSERHVNFAKTFRGLGHQIHLIQDKTVPDHVRNDAHPEDALLGKDAINGALFFETWAKNNARLVNSYALNAKQFIPTVSLNVSHEGLAPITQFYDTNKYTIENPSQFFTSNQAISLAVGLAEYTNANFFSGDTIFAAERYPSDHRHYFPYPRKSSTDLDEYILQVKPLLTQVAEDGIKDKGIYIRKQRDGEIIDHFMRVSYWTSKIYKVFGEGSLFYRSFYRDEKCHEDYASLLIPRAVGYSAGLLNYFFRGEIDMVPAATGSGYLIENKTDENMSGKFELWYDSRNDERKRIWQGDLNIARQSKSSTVNFSPPTDLKEPDKYILVFRGKMGNEENAVVGRQVEFKGEELVFLVSTAPYGKTDDNSRIFITLITMFKINTKNNRYELIPVDTFKIDGEMYFDGTKTTSLIINSNNENNFHTVNYTMHDEESGIYWSEKLENYGAITVSGYGSEYPAKGSYHPYLKAYLAEWKYPSTPWASGRRTSYTVWRYYKGSFLGFRYTGGKTLEDIGKDWALDSYGRILVEGDSYTLRHTVISRTENKSIYIQRDSNFSKEYSHFYCEHIDIYGNVQEIYDFDLDRLAWNGQMKLFFGDTLIKELDYYGMALWHAYGSISSGAADCNQAFYDSYIAEYIETLPSGGRIRYLNIASDKIIEIIDYDNYNDDELFILFYSIKDYKGYGYPVEYFLVYKTKDSKFVEVFIYKGRQGIDRLYGVSCQLNKDSSIIYSYHIQHTLIPWPPQWHTEKFIMGIINIADNKLPIGYRQEFEYSPLEEQASPDKVRLSHSGNGNLSPGIYTYYISAVNPINQTLPSAPVSITLGNNVKGVILEWNKVEGATHYIVYGRNQEARALAIVGETVWEDNGINLELEAGILNSSIKNPWELPKSPIKPFLNAIGIHKK